MQETLYYNGHIHCGDGQTCTALRVREGRIFHIGGPELLKEAQGIPAVDLHGAWVAPGFNDSHLHLLDVGRGLGAIDLFGATSPADMAARCADFIRRRNIPAGRALYGNGWNQDKFDGAPVLPTRADLDALVPDHPLLLDRVCGHIMVCNTAALKAAGITAHTPVPEGGGIDLGPDGQPNGLLRDNAIPLVRAILPGESVEDIKSAFVAACARAVSKGLTTVQTCDIRSRDWPLVLQALRELDEADLLPLRLTLQCALDTPEDLRAFLDADIENGRMWKVGPLKLFLDGSLGARTAWMRRDYADEPGQRGLCCLAYDTALTMARMADEAGMQVVAHAIGDAAVDEMLNVIEALCPGGENPRRHGVVHCQITTRDQWDRFAALHAGAMVQPVFLDYDHTIVTARCGADLAATSYAFGTAVRLGVPVSYGTDAPVEDLDPLRNYYCAVTRRPLAGGEPWQPEECVTRAEALACYTKGSAFNEFAEGEKGMLLPGYLADFVVLDGDLLTVPEEQLLQLRVLATVVGGREVYTAPGALV